MGQVPIKIGERSYRLSCGDGEEARVEALADYINAKMHKLGGQHGQIGEERLMLMAMLLITDELFDARETGQASGGTAGLEVSDAPAGPDGDDAGEAV